MRSQDSAVHNKHGDSHGHLRLFYGQGYAEIFVHLRDVHGMNVPVILNTMPRSAMLRMHHEIHVLAEGREP